MQSTTENPNAAMYEAENKRKEAIKAYLTKQHAERVTAIETAAKEQLPPTPTQIEADIAKLEATGFSVPAEEPMPAPAPRPQAR